MYVCMNFSSKTSSFCCHVFKPVALLNFKIECSLWIKVYGASQSVREIKKDLRIIRRTKREKNLFISFCCSLPSNVANNHPYNPKKSSKLCCMSHQLLKCHIAQWYIQYPIQPLHVVIPSHNSSQDNLRPHRTHPSTPWLLIPNWPHQFLFFFSSIFCCGMSENVEEILLSNYQEPKIKPIQH